MNSFNPSVTDVGEIPADILAKLEALPNNKKAEIAKRQKEIDAAIRMFYPQKSSRAIAGVFGVTQNTILNRAKELGL